ncbi:PIG-L deacetylase family protein [Microlunatus soli]|uniref:N-acetylglucosaminyl deacetylase, LmbE family n=1 Tax=Microlunatus soli TaxID=630515 RepID=A0A1H1R5Y5_9ACTN|nr:PIG-L deacetylase family protein [Microlunatus soli]SDS30349.1 N-acetylglucosaminyl deacetylase, LmbE family [Microlunatus soli]
MSDRLRVLVVVAHPDEAEEYVAGTLAQLTARGHHVKVLSATNGDAGHHSLRRKPLALRRAEEAYAALRILDLADYEIWDVHDGDLMDSLENRHRMVTAIRRWRADMIITFTDEGPGHSDNRTAALLVRRATDLLTLRNQCPKVPALDEVPIVLRMIDDGSTDRHRHQVAVDIGSTLTAKLRACAAHRTQFLEFAATGNGWADDVPDVDDHEAVDAFILQHWNEFFVTPAAAGPALERAYGPEAEEIEYCETFDLAPYGRPTTAEEIDRLLVGSRAAGTEAIDRC